MMARLMQHRSFLRLDQRAGTDEALFLTVKDAWRVIIANSICTSLDERWDDLRPVGRAGMDYQERIWWETAEGVYRGEGEHARQVMEGSLLAAQVRLLPPGSHWWDGTPKKENAPALEPDGLDMWLE